MLMKVLAKKNSEEKKDLLELIFAIIIDWGAIILEITEDVR